MSIKDDRWFEVWYIDGVDVIPSCLYIVSPNPDRSGRIRVLVPYDSNTVKFEGKDYEETCNWLGEDEFERIDGRIFPDDGWPLETKPVIRS